ncbi:unnamed protein product [Heligmosomoides polygyrus]|uniref:Uncharacterized protein n=1 Tax=Heligmosomoides polygyrus TaxID=6339 RepID=A0A183GM87_HELPZ|nr:unnamed protein product [Heligmosomoides polygyrus]
MISVGVMVLVCASLSLLCVLIWFLRCRRDQLRHKKGRGDRQRDMDSYQEYVYRSSRTYFKEGLLAAQRFGERTELVLCRFAHEFKHIRFYENSNNELKDVLIPKNLGAGVCISVHF